MSLQSTATCNCGSVKVTIQYAEGQDLPSVLCHCENCIKSSGSGIENISLCIYTHINGL
ncbi:hypothetical protein BJY04DRAFT_198976 [Aspergillus karnatakaensis]|uniref:uncharacterized protein n=1 Tax=Aspergillus karnatakaensis TaxID=1810916 RepID=UPI003CCDE5B4